MPELGQADYDPIPWISGLRASPYDSHVCVYKTISTYSDQSVIKVDVSIL